MTGDRMHVLSGLSLLSLSSGTLPAVKSGMNLDANPFASQLALMTGPDAAIGGSAVPVAVDGEFALALAEVADTPLTAAVVDSTIPLPQVIQPPVAPAALSADATPSQVIEAVLNGSAGEASAEQVITAPAAVITDSQKRRPQAMVAVDAEAKAAVQPQAQMTDDAVDPEQILTDTKDSHSRRSAKTTETEPKVADPTIIAPAIAPVTTPVAADPDAIAPETGTTRVAISTAPTPASGPVGEEAAAPSADSRSAADLAMSDTTTIAPPTPRSSAPATAAAASVEGASKPVDTMATAPAAPSPVAAAPVEPIAPAIPATTIAASAPPAAALTLQPSRAATLAPRAVAGTTAQRAVQAAVQSPQPAQALAALFNLSDAAAEPAPVEAFAEALTTPRTETIQPSWVAALNAVTSPATSPVVQALTAPTATAGAQGPFESIAFDAGFIGNIETQISRVANGGQMVRMQIMPEHLGRIDIEMLAGPDRDQVRLVTEHDAVRDTLVQSQVRLEQDLRQNGQRNAEVTVELRQQSAGTQGGSAQQQRGQAGTDVAAQRDAAQRQNSGGNADTPTPAQRRPRGNVRYA